MKFKTVGLETDSGEIGIDRLPDVTAGLRQRCRMSDTQRFLRDGQQLTKRHLGSELLISLLLLLLLMLRLMLLMMLLLVAVTAARVSRKHPPQFHRLVSGWKFAAFRCCCCSRRCCCRACCVLCAVPPSSHRRRLADSQRSEFETFKRHTSALIYLIFFG